MQTWETNDPTELYFIASSIIASIHPNKKIAFYGEMGAGKTTLIKEICKTLGVEENTSSPTFAIINEYIGKEKIYHLDLFRIATVHELIDIGLEEYLDSDNYLFIEWPDLIKPILEEYGFSTIHISAPEHTKRIITLES